MKQAHDLAADAVYRRYVRTLFPIAKHAGVGQVFTAGKAAVLRAKDVIHLMIEAGIILMDQAVFAAPSRPFGDLAAQGLGNLTGHE
jgi:hypothetical protein